MAGRLGARAGWTQNLGAGESQIRALAASLPANCPRCGHTTDDELSATLGVCPSCRYHWRIPARMRLAVLLDPGTFVEEDADLAGDDPLQFACPVSYRDLQAAAQQRTGLTEAVITGQGAILGHRAGVAVFDFGFMGGTMGVAAGEKLVRLLERSTRWRRPVVMVTASGGVRLQEGTPALSQMAAVAAAMQRHHAAGLLSITGLADPTTGGVLVAPGTLGDIVLAEPGAHIAFAGARVSGLTHPQTAEWVYQQGMIDAVVDRAALRQTIGQLVDFLTRKSQPLPRRLRSAPSLPALPGETGPDQGRAAIELARRVDRPTSLDYISRLTQGFIELHGDRLHGDDASIVGGIGSLQGQSVIFIGEERSRPSTDPDRQGRQGPEGFRKVLRLASLAATFGLPIITLIDTPGAYTGEDAEGHGLAFALGRCLRTFSMLPVPVVAAIVGEGTSGAAIALVPSDRLLMQQHATFESISPEGAAAILGRDREDVLRIAESMRITAQDALALGVIDEIVPEPGPGAHADPDAAAALLREALVAALAESQRWLPSRLVERRYQRLRAIGAAHVRPAGTERQSEPLRRHSNNTQPADSRP
jgi:acyl-CoA carboxylase subunit beta